MKSQRTNNRILLVSDDSTVRESLGEMLHSGGYKVLFAKTGQEAIGSLEVNRISAIVLDHRTPFSSADKTGKKGATLEALTDFNPLLSLVLTRDANRNLDHASSLMADLILTHPVTPSVLLEGVDTVLMETLQERVRRKSESLTLHR